MNISKNIARLNTGVITSYALYILIELILYLLFNAYIHGSIIISLLMTLSSVYFNGNTHSTVIYVNAILNPSWSKRIIFTYGMSVKDFIDSIPSGLSIVDAIKSLTIEERVKLEVTNILERVPRDLDMFELNIKASYFMVHCIKMARFPSKKNIRII